MATIADLDFKPHKYMPQWQFARIPFNNGYEAAVARGFWGEPNKYEVSVMHGDAPCYDTPVTDDVCGHLTKRQANEILRQIEALPQRKKQEVPDVQPG